MFDDREICKRYEDKDTLLKGKVLKENLVDGKKSYSVLVQEIFKAPEDSPLVVGNTADFRTGLNSAMCGYDMDIDAEYLIDSATGVVSCSLVTEFDKLEPDALQALEWGGFCTKPVVVETSTSTEPATSTTTATMTSTTAATATAVHNGGYTTRAYVGTQTVPTNNVVSEYPSYKVENIYENTEAGIASKGAGKTASKNADKAEIKDLDNESQDLPVKLSSSSLRVEISTIPLLILALFL
ncbi:MAG: hypothetical protein SGCHY_001813 [Lobulomycetales sp.]